MRYEEFHEYRERFLKMISEKQLVDLKSMLSEMNVVDVAEIIEDMDDKNMLLTFRMLPKEMSAEVFSYMETYDQKRIVGQINNVELQSMIEFMDFDDLIDFLEEMPANVVTKVLEHSTPQERTEINKFLMYPKDSAGSMMTIEYVSLNPNWTVGESLKHIRMVGMDKETIYTCYVESEYKQLLGFISLRTLVVSEKNLKIKDIMETDYIYLNTMDDQEVVAEAFHLYGFIALPVVDREHRLCGIITFDDAMEIMEEETTEDIHKMAAITPSDVEYLDQTAWELAKLRLPWLLILMISATITGNIIDNFSFIISHYIILTIFIPMITDTGGNSGSQSSTIVIRALATGEISLSDGLKVMKKEIQVGVIAGAALSVVNFFRMLIFTDANFTISLLVSATIFFTVILAKLMGALLPILAKRLHIDPAVMASALITTIIDSVVLLIYFGLAMLILPIP